MPQRPERVCATRVSSGSSSATAGECDFYGATLKDVLFERCELREATFSAITLERVELRSCDLNAARGGETPKGARMPWNDVIENAAPFAQIAGVEIVG